MNIGLVVTPEGGLPIRYEVFDGNRADMTTVREMVRMTEEKYGKAHRILVLDRGIMSEDNMDFLREREARYIVGTPKSDLKKFEAVFLEEANWVNVRARLDVKLAAHADGKSEEQYRLLPLHLP